jgi:hypothetical protein
MTGALLLITQGRIRSPGSTCGRATESSHEPRPRTPKGSSMEGTTVSRTMICTVDGMHG